MVSQSHFRKSSISFLPTWLPILGSSCNADNCCGPAAAAADNSNSSSASSSVAAAAAAALSAAANSSVSSWVSLGWWDRWHSTWSWLRNDDVYFDPNTRSTKYMFLMHGLYGGKIEYTAISHSLLSRTKDLGVRNVYMWRYPSYSHSFSELAELFDMDLQRLAQSGDKGLELFHPDLNTALRFFEDAAAVAAQDEKNDSEIIEVIFVTHSMGALTLRAMLSPGVLQQKGDTFLLTRLRELAEHSERRIHLRIIQIAPANRGVELTRYLFRQLFYEPMARWYEQQLARLGPSNDPNKLTALRELHNHDADYFENNYILHDDLLGDHEKIRTEIHAILATTDSFLSLPRWVVSSDNDGAVSLNDQQPIQRHQHVTRVHQVSGGHMTVLFSAELIELMHAILDGRETLHRSDSGAKDLAASSPRAASGA